MTSLLGDLYALAAMQSCRLADEAAIANLKSGCAADYIPTLSQTCCCNNGWPSSPVPAIFDACWFNHVTLPAASVLGKFGMPCFHCKYAARFHGRMRLRPTTLFYAGTLLTVI